MPGIRKWSFACSYILILGGTIPYLQANPYWLKTKNINSLIFFWHDYQVISKTTSPQIIFMPNINTFTIDVILKTKIN